MSGCAGAVLVGGRGSRLAAAVARHSAKPLLPLGHATVLDHVLAGVLPQVAACCLCAHDDAVPWARFGLPVVFDDAHAGHQGPLAGILAGLAWAEAQGFATVLIVPGDTPFLPHDLLSTLGAAPAVAEAGGRVHHLVCHLPVMCRPVLAEALAHGHSRVGQALEALGATRMVFAEPSAFLNINTPHDYAQAQERVAGAAHLQSVTP